MGASHTFHRSERLKDQKIIDAIFNKKGKSIKSGPLLFVYYQQELQTRFPAQILLSVSKKKFKRAHDRNRIKRLLRESYRLNKQRIYDIISPTDKQFALALLYLSKDPLTLEQAELHLNKIISEFSQRHI